MTQYRTASRDSSAARLRPFATWLAAVCAALAAVTWQVLVKGPLTAPDWPVHAFVDPRQPDGPLLWAAVAVARMGQRLVTVPPLVALGLWVTLLRRDARPLLAVLAGLGSLAVVGTLLKVATGRTPPVVGVDVVTPGLANVLDWTAAAVVPGAAAFEGYVSFPSGHSANAALTYPLVAWLLFGANGLRPDPRRLRAALWAALLPVAAVGAMMTLLDYHWASETLGGWLLGACVLLVARLVLGRGDTGAVAAGSAPERWRGGPAGAPGGTG
ncbi:phosphatase PAP2 family protein [Actinorugispora endophytica]|uniref:PAP2 superfamily protein n=1 Tax=Actinorugispora endophytica TaxID=1605990 RepID=A0A4R6UKG8_9ACTN|nr:phosphatase PAP2 family protein [Actinorugispora endophytica]TDQ45605.1 PAP2 superfamily protein [Actinorugispora endophytica]